MITLLLATLLVQGDWPWTPLENPVPPAAGHPVDAFVDAKLKAAGIKPAPPADKRTLLRRVTFDLTGLPPTLAEIGAFLESVRTGQGTGVTAAEGCAAVELAERITKSVAEQDWGAQLDTADTPNR